MRTLHRAVAVAAVCAALSACHGGTPAASPSASTMDEAQILVVARQYAQCMREHGLPSYGDPSVRDGRLRGFEVPPEGPPPEDLERVADEACKHILDALPPSVTDAELSEAEVAELVLFAKCMRDNGVPEWPDPKSDGSFPIHGTPLDSKTDERVNTANRACKQHAKQGLRVS